MYFCYSLLITNHYLPLRPILNNKKSIDACLHTYIHYITLPYLTLHVHPYIHRSIYPYIHIYIYMYIYIYTHIYIVLSGHRCWSSRRTPRIPWAMPWRSPWMAGPEKWRLGGPERTWGMAVALNGETTGETAGNYGKITGNCGKLWRFY